MSPISGAPRQAGPGKAIAIAVIVVGRQRNAVEFDFRQPARKVIRVAIRIRHALHL